MSPADQFRLTGTFTPIPGRIRFHVKLMAFGSLALASLTMLGVFAELFPKAPPPRTLCARLVNRGKPGHGLHRVHHVRPAFIVGVYRVELVPKMGADFRVDPRRSDLGHPCILFCALGANPARDKRTLRDEGRWTGSIWRYRHIESLGILDRHSHRCFVQYWDRVRDRYISEKAFRGEGAAHCRYSPRRRG